MPWRPFLLFAALALLYAAGGMLPGRCLVPLDVPRDYLAWKADPAVRVRVSNSLLSDVALQLVPWDVEGRRLLAEGRMPWRNRYAGDGEHLFANPLAGQLSPFTWIRLAMGIGGWAWSVALKLLAAMLSMFWLARVSGADDRASTISGLVFALSGYSICWALYPHTNVFVLLPAFAAASIQLAREYRPGRLVAVAALAALMTAGGHPETLAIGVVFIFIFLFNQTGRRAWTPIAASAAGFLMIGVQLVPFAILLARSHIRFARLEQVGGGLRKFSLPALLLPGYLGSPLRGELDLTGAVHSLENFNQRNGAFVGALVLIAIVATFRSLATVYRSAVLIGCAALAISLQLPVLSALFHSIPIVKWVAFEYYAVGFVVLVSLAAGPALVGIADAPRRRILGAGLIAAGVLLVVLGAIPRFAPDRLDRLARDGVERLRSSGYLNQPAAVYEQRMAGYLRSAGSTAVRRALLPGICWTVFGAALSWRGRARRWLIPAAAVAELIAFGVGYNPSIRLDEVAPEPRAITEIKRRDPNGLWMAAASSEVLPPNTSTLYGVREVHSYDILTSEDETRRLVPTGYDALHWALPLIPSLEQQRALARLGVRYYVVPTGVIEISGASMPERPENAPPEGLAAGIATSIIAVLLLVGLLGGRRRIRT